ncbi:hypothetical protein MKX03_000200 [Papaver bracteatum]|nr:hypothetical protein MKX03_000200 [Papaver bracteatum]
MQSLSRGAPHGAVVVSPLPNQRITAYSNLIRFSSSPFKNSLPVSRLKVCSSMKLIPNVAKQTPASLITEISSVVPHNIGLLVEVIIGYGLLRVVIELIHKLLTWEWDFVNVNDLMSTEVDGREIFGFVERKGWFGGITIKMEDGDDFPFQTEKQTNGERVNWRFTTELKVEMDQVKRIQEEINKIFEEDKDLEQEDSYALVHDVDSTNRIAVLIVSCFTKTDTHEDYFKIRDAMLLRLRKLVDSIKKSNPLP